MKNQLLLRIDKPCKNLAPIADCFLLHNRNIAARYDDSVTKIVADQPVYYDGPEVMHHNQLKLSYCTEQTILSFGGQLKNTFCFLKGNQAFISPHIGDLDNLNTINHCENTIKKYRQLFSLKEQLLACDLHPDYASTKLAQQIIFKNKFL